MEVVSLRNFEVMQRYSRTAAAAASHGLPPKPRALIAAIKSEDSFKVRTGHQTRFADHGGEDLKSEKERGARKLTGAGVVPPSPRRCGVIYWRRRHAGLGRISGTVWVIKF